MKFAAVLANWCLVQVVFMSDGADTVRNLQRYLHPNSEHIIDWFHIAMRFTVMNQQNKAVIDDDATFGTEVANTLSSVKHYLWHGNVDTALERLDRLSFELDMRPDQSKSGKLRQSVKEFYTYICNNRKFIPNFGERYRQGDLISTSFVESTINRRAPKSRGSHPYIFSP
jgi:hypothetical protein